MAFSTRMKHLLGESVIRLAIFQQQEIPTAVVLLKTKFISMVAKAREKCFLTICTACRSLNK